MGDIDGATYAVAEGLAAGAATGITARARDPDTANWVNYSLLDDADGAFVIDAASGVVTTALTVDREGAGSASSAIMVAATSGDGTSSQANVTIAVTDTSDTAISAISDTDTEPDRVLKGAAAGTFVDLTAFASDPDLADTVTYSLDDEAGGAGEIVMATEALEADDFLIFDAGSGQLYYDADGSDAGEAQQIALLDGVTTLTETVILIPCPSDSTNGRKDLVLAPVRNGIGNALAAGSIRLGGTPDHGHFVVERDVGILVQQRLCRAGRERFVAQRIGEEAADELTLQIGAGQGAFQRHEEGDVGSRMLQDELRGELFGLIPIGTEHLKDEIAADAAAEIHDHVGLGRLLLDAAQQGLVQPQAHRVVGILVKHRPRVIMGDVVLGLIVGALRQIDRVLGAKGRETLVVGVTHLRQTADHDVGLGNLGAGLVGIDQADRALDGLEAVGAFGGEVGDVALGQFHQARIKVAAVEDPGAAMAKHEGHVGAGSDANFVDSLAFEAGGLEALLERDCPGIGGIERVPGTFGRRGGIVVA